MTALRPPRQIIPVPTFSVMTVSGFLDSATCTLVRQKPSTGGAIDEGDSLLIVGTSEVVVPGTDAPLVVPKATLTVVANAGEYIVARANAPLLSPGENLGRGLSALVDQLVRQQALTSNTGELLGNPGAAPVRIGDLVVRKDDLQRLVSYLKRYPQPRS